MSSYELVIDGLWRRTVRAGAKFDPGTGHLAQLGRNTDPAYAKDVLNLWPREGVKPGYDSLIQSITGPHAHRRRR